MDAKNAKAESIIRMSGRDINGSLNIVRGVMQIKGIGWNLANAIATCYEAKYGISENTKIGTLEDAQIAQLEAIIKEPAKAGVPLYMLNRRKDAETGADMHVVGTDLIVKVRQDIDMGIKMQTWIGSRHQYGQRVRGQRTRSTGRTGTTVGVMKKSAIAPGAAAAAEEKGKSGSPGKPGAAKPAAGAKPEAAAPAAAPAAK